MKIDIVVYSLRGGGAERVAANLANGWQEVGHRVRVVMHEPLDTVEYGPVRGVDVVSTAGRDGGISRAPVRMLRLRRFLNGRRPDLVVAIQGNMAIESVVATLGLKLCIIGCEHNMPSRAVGGWPWRSLRPWAYRRLAAVAALTEGAAAELREICRGSNIRVIPNAVRLPLSDSGPMVSSAELVPSGAPVLLAAGRMVEAKGFDDLIVRFASIAPLCPEARLVILGDGPLTGQLKRQIRDLGLERRILMPGRAGNISEWYGRAALYVMTSRWEGLPMVMLEAMAHGLPVVATDFRYGPRDVITDGMDGRVIPREQREAWVRVVVDLLNNNELRAAMAREATDVTTRFGETSVMQRWRRLFDELGLPDVAR